MIPQKCKSQMWQKKLILVHSQTCMLAALSIATECFIPFFKKEKNNQTFFYLTLPHVWTHHKHSKAVTNTLHLISNSLLLLRQELALPFCQMHPLHRVCVWLSEETQRTTNFPEAVLDVGGLLWPKQQIPVEIWLFQTWTTPENTDFTGLLFL